MKSKILLLLITLRLLTNDGVIVENRNARHRKQPQEVSAAIIRPWKRGDKFYVETE